MKNNYSEKGFAIPVIIAIIAAVLVLSGVIYYTNQSQTGNDKMTQEKAMMEKEAMEQKEKDAMMEKKDVVVTLSAQNNSGQSGQATLSDINGKTKVVINVASGAVDVAQPAHIHMGACPNPGAVAYPLANVVNGKSETILDVSIETLKSKLPLAVNTHKSSADIKIYVSCGDILSEAMMKKTEGETIMTKYTGTVLAGKSAPLLDYNKADYDAAIASDNLVVLYFYANWCPICKTEIANALYPAFNELTTDKVVGIRVSYKDNETDSDEKALAVQYGIPYQHTKVFLKNGKQILKAPDSWNKMRYLDEINKAITQ